MLGFAGNVNCQTPVFDPSLATLAALPLAFADTVAPLSRRLVGFA